MTRLAPSPGRYTLVLGSGGVKSVAGLGAAQVFEEHGLLPSAVVGCSAGAIFGAGLACGMGAESAIALAPRLWTREVTAQRRGGALLKLVLPRLARFDESFSFRKDQLIMQRLQQAFGERQIEDLPLPLRVQATCARTGAGVLLDSGPLAGALRASLALPFLFAPHPLGGRLLVDGSLSDPLPVAAAPAHGVVVALGFRTPAPQRLNSATRLATRVTAILSNNLLQGRLDAADHSRLVLMLPEPRQRIGLFDTHAMPELVALGRQAALAALPRLQMLLAQQGPMQRAA
jgi:NTE family protein